MQDKANTPAEINETQLDDISGGPHFRNFHGTSFDFQSGSDMVLTTPLQTADETKEGSQFDCAWDVEANQPA